MVVAGLLNGTRDEAGRWVISSHEMLSFLEKQGETWFQLRLEKLKDELREAMARREGASEQLEQ
jgi:uncharacterized protein YdaU (DUF1376 family)